MGAEQTCYKCNTQNYRVPQGIPHKAESPITSFILFFLVLIFLSFFSDTIFIETKLILLFLSTKQKTFLKNIYSIFLVSVTPELPPPAILPQVLPATLTPAFSSADPEEDHFSLKRDLLVLKSFGNVSDTGLEDPQAVAFLKLVDLAHWALVPKQTRESERDVTPLLTIG